MTDDPRPADGHTQVLSGRSALVTGGTGYIGEALIRHLQAKGCRVVALSRRRPAALAGDGRFFAWRIGEAVPRDAWANEDGTAVDWVFHLAHDWDGDTDPPESSVNYRGLRLLLEDARKHGVRRFVTAGSQSAVAETPGPYGKVKRASEGLLSGPDEIAARIGFVSGGAWGGPAGRLIDLLGKLPAMPAPASGPVLQPVHVDDLCAALAVIAANGWAEDAPPFLAGPDRVAFADYARRTALARLGRAPVMIPVPPGLLAALGRLLPGSLGDRIVGLAVLRAVPVSVPRGIDFRNFDAILAETRTPDRVRPMLVREARMLFAHLIPAPPPEDVVRAYADALAADGCAPLTMPANGFSAAVTLRWRETVRSDPDLRDRLAFALALLERHPEGPRLLRESARGPIRLVALAGGLALDLIFAVLGRLSPRHA